MVTEQLLQKYPIISDQITLERLRVVLTHLEQALEQGTKGDIVEFGCYIGTTSLFIRRMLDAYTQSGTRELHVYDSFAGLPEKGARDNSTAGDQFKAGELYVSKKQLQQAFRKANLQPPIIHKGWFNELKTEDVPDHIAFAFLDGDFYDSIMNSLNITWPKLDTQAVVTIDDFGREALPGTERAVRDFLHGKTANLHVEHNIAIIRL